jgi:competence protein ComEC
MKSPALWIFTSLSAGILLAPLLHKFSFAAFVTACGVLLIVALTCWSWRREWIAFGVVLLAWVSLGAACVGVAGHAEPSDRVSTLASRRSIDLGEALRWHGVLRADPLRMPWGWRFEIGLDGAEMATGVVPMSGGLRLTYYGDENSLPVTMRAGDQVEAIAKASLPHNYGDPGAFDYRAQMAREGVDLTGSLRSLKLIEITGARDNSPRYWLARARGVLLARIDDLFGEERAEAAVLRAMLLGDRTFIDTEVAEEFRKTSSFHVLVVAGLHVAALAGFIFWIGRRLRLNVTVSSLLALCALAAYVGIVQDRTPVVRAALMAAAYLLARGLYRRIDILQAVALAALAIVFMRPGELADPSFQLSFLAVGAIATLAMPLLSRTAEPARIALLHVGDVTRDPSHAPRLVQLRLDLRSIAARIARSSLGQVPDRAARVVAFAPLVAVAFFETFVISCAIQLGLVPLSVAEFHRVALIGPIANIGAVFLTALIVPMGFATLALGAVWRGAGRLLARATGFATSAAVASNRWFAHVGWSSHRVPDAPAWLVVAFFAALIAAAILLRRGAIRWASAPLAAGLIAAAMIFAHPFAPVLARGRLEVTVLDVGQGDSIFVASPEGKTLLVDGGQFGGFPGGEGMREKFDVGEEVISRYLWSRGLKRLDAVALTHAHEDHLDGLPAVLENFRVRELWVGHDVHSAAYRDLLAIAVARGTRIVHWKQGDELSWGGVHGEVLWPDSDDEVRTAGNNDSLVIRLSEQREAVLLTGDIERPVEERLAHAGLDLGAEFLKVPHHGSKTSSTEDFLAGVRPEFAAISVGENNPFNHPSAEVLERLSGDGVKTYRTDRDGAITFTTNGSSVRVSCFVQTQRQAAAYASDALR